MIKLAGRLICLVLGAAPMLFGGILYVSEGSPSNRIVSYDSAGASSPFFSGSAFPAIAVDATGNLYATDFSNQLVMFTPGGVESTIASGLNLPTYLMVGA